MHEVKLIQYIPIQTCIELFILSCSLVTLLPEIFACLTGGKTTMRTDMEIMLVKLEGLKLNENEAIFYQTGFPFKG